MMDMLNDFFSYSSMNNDVLAICESLNAIKKGIEMGNYAIHYETNELFHNVLKYALDTRNEKLANAQYVFSQYYHLFTSLALYFKQLQDKEYRESWNTLQDCFDIIRIIGRFVESENRLEVPQIADLLKQFEKLYPFTLFGSSEYVISQSHCSICGKSMLDLQCPHRKGRLYWGEMALEIVDKIEEIQAIAIVSNPEDKRCVVEVEKDIEDKNKYSKLELFMNLNLPLLRTFTIDPQMEIRKKDDIKAMGRNELCPCGSGKKYKKCCGFNQYYNHINYRIKPGRMVSFYFFDINHPNSTVEVLL